MIKELSKYYEKGITHSATIAASKDERILTFDLIVLAKKTLQQQKNKEEIPNFALITLHYRNNRNTLNKSINLLQSYDPIDREIGCVILREFPCLNDAPYPQSPTIIKEISKMIEKEDNLDVLLSGLSAIGWQCHPDGKDILLSYLSDPRNAVRLVVADNLLMVNPEESCISEEIFKAYLSFADDTDEDIRWTIFYDISEYPDMFNRYKIQLLEISKKRSSDKNEDVREIAKIAYNKLLE
jgi:hypothetical protein